MRRYLHASVTRITDLEHRPFEVHPLPRDRWETADYRAVEVLGPSHYPFEIANGRLVDAVAGDLVIGALGQALGDARGRGRLEPHERHGRDARAHRRGPVRSRHVAIHVAQAADPDRVPRPRHARRLKLNMRDFVRPVTPAIPLAPLILLVGTSMSAGKTTTARVVVRMLAERGLRVLACKLTGRGTLPGHPLVPRRGRRARQWTSWTRACRRPSARSPITCRPSSTCCRAWRPSSPT